MGLFSKGNTTQRDEASYIFNIGYITDTHFIIDKIKCSNITKPHIECLINIGFYINCNIYSELFTCINTSNNISTYMIGTIDEDNFVDVLVYSSMYNLKRELYRLINGTNYISTGENNLISCIKHALYYTPKELNMDLINNNVLDATRFMYVSTDIDIDVSESAIEMINYDKDIIKEDLDDYSYELLCNFDIYVNTLLVPYVYNILPFIDFKIIFPTSCVLVLRMNGSNAKRFIKFLERPELVFTEEHNEKLNEQIKSHGAHLRTQLKFILNIPDYSKSRKSVDPVVEEVIGDETEEVIDLEEDVDNLNEE